MIDNAYHWYPVYTKSRFEKKAFEELTRKGIEVYLPLQRQLKQWSDRKKWVEEPLLKSYIFVHISNREHAEVLMTQGISRFIYFAGKIATIPDRQIEDLKLLLASADELQVVEHHVAPGKKVLINAGPLKGIVAEAVEMKGKKHVLLKLENMGLSIDIKVSLAFVETLE